LASESVPRAGGQTIIAAVYAVSDKGTKFNRDRALEFDREIRDAAAGIQMGRGGDAAGRAGGDAAAAGAAAGFFWGIGIKLVGSDDFREEDPIAEPAADEVRVFADKAQASALGEIPLKERAGVHIPQGFGGRLERVDEDGELFEAFAYEVVVVGKAGVA